MAKDGEVVFAKGYGLANAEHEISNTPETKFRLGSITKQFTATAIMVLQDRDKLKVEEPIGNYLADAPPARERVTIHHLLTQATGQGRIEAFPESSTDFFLKVIDAQLTFVQEDGRITQLILHQHGRDVPAKRVDE